MSNVLQVRVNDELLERFKGKPDDIKEALTLYLRVEQGFLHQYDEQFKDKEK